MQGGPSFPILYSLRDIGEDLEAFDEIDLTLRWESVLETDRHGEETNEGIEEMNGLLRQRVEGLLREKEGVCVRVKHERVTQSRNFAHGSIVVVGEYILELFRKRKP